MCVWKLPQKGNQYDKTESIKLEMEYTEDIKFHSAIDFGICEIDEVLQGDTIFEEKFYTKIKSTSFSKEPVHPGSIIKQIPYGNSAALNNVTKKKTKIFRDKDKIARPTKKSQCKSKIKRRNLTGLQLLNDINDSGTNNNSKLIITKEYPVAKKKVLVNSQPIETINQHLVNITTCGMRTKKTLVDNLNFSEMITHKSELRVLITDIKEQLIHQHGISDGHFTTNGEATVFHCLHCKQEFELDSSKVIHKGIDAENKALVDFYYKKRVDENFVMQKTHRTVNKSFTCFHCKKCFLHKNLLKIHMRYHTKRLPICSDYNKNASDKSSLIPHKKISSTEKPYVCSYCKKNFGSKCYLAEHVTIHTGEKPYACFYCEKRFRIKYSLVVHERTHTGEKPYECSYCQKRFGRKNNLIVHERSHTGEKPFVCSYCEKRFVSKSVLVLHERNHTGHKPFACSYCEMCFRDKSVLGDHERSHTGEKPFVCSYCQKGFGRRSSLIVHERSHTREKSFVCSYCEKRYVSRGVLVLHERMHTGEKTIACSYCKKIFRTKYDLGIHKVIHTGKRPFICLFCNRGFNTKSNLKRHNKVHKTKKS